MSKRIYVGYLAPDTSRAALEKLFSEFGAVESVNLITDRETGRPRTERDVGRPRGFGFVEMKNSEEADRALKALSGREFGGTRLKLSTRPFDKG